ncbi:MAG: ABC transporter substrate-binding protein, partial [Xanthobacteraceae bacterium]
GLPATAPIPSSTPMTDLSAKPPPGVGSYRIADVSPGRRWTMVKNPGFARAQIPDVPVGNLERVTVKVEPDARSAISKVLRGRADGFDPATPLPAGTRSRVRSAAEDRFEFVPIPSTLYFYLNTAAPPFSSELARRAVVTALDRPALARLAKNSIVPECYLIPAGISGHPTDGCPYGGADDTGDRRAGRQLVEESGTEGAPVTISVDANWPQPAYGRYFAKLLTRLGFEAHLEIARTRPPGTGDHAAGDVQAGFASWFNDFPAPADFFAVLDGRAAGGAESPNAGGVQDPFIQQQLEKLSLVPAQESSTSSDDWRDLDEYAAQKAYLAVFATQQVPKLLSDRISFDSAVIHPLFLSDWSSWELR